jgi:hypothetical protein
MTWLIGMKLSVIDGSALSSPHDQVDLPQKLATKCRGYMAPFGAPVLPEV